MAGRSNRPAAKKAPAAKPEQPKTETATPPNPGLTKADVTPAATKPAPTETADVPGPAGTSPVESATSEQAPAPAEDEPKLDTKEKEYVVRAAVLGLRNGRPWPVPGQTIKLPKHEGEHYVALGYVAELDA